MFERHLRERLLHLARGFPVVVLTGPRQSGKTTLVRAAFPDHAYVSLEDPDLCERVANDPRGFLAAQRGGVLIDEVQRVPALLSYVQTWVDAKPRMGRVVLTGSQNLLLLAAVSQSLAGRAGYAELLPLSYAEAGACAARLTLDEYLKYLRHLGLSHAPYFWRDHVGNEVDLLIERSGTLWPVEMKSGATFQRDWLRPLQTWRAHAATARQGTPMLVSAVPGVFETEGVLAANWRDALATLQPASASPRA